MTYVPHNAGDREEMLRALGKKSVEELLDDLPRSMRFEGDLPLPAPLSQKETEDELGMLAEENRPAAAVAELSVRGRKQPPEIPLAHPQFQ